MTSNQVLMSTMILLAKSAADRISESGVAPSIDMEGEDFWNTFMMYSIGSFVVTLLLTIALIGSIATYYPPREQKQLGVGDAAFVATRQVSKPKEVSKRYFTNAKEADDYWLASGGKPQKSFSYGTVIYIPEKAVTDFGQSVWPPAYLKKNVCPRVVLVSTWTNSRFALPGGKGKGRESALDALNREFGEETGCSVNFDETTYAFSLVDDKKANHYFVKAVRDESEFNGVLKSFTDSSDRKAFVDEIFGSIAFPIWVEGPENAKSGTLWGDTQVWGLPRFLNSGSFREQDRDPFLILLAKAKVLDMVHVKRVFDLTNALQEESLRSSWLKRTIHLLKWLLRETADLPSFEEFVSTPGLSAIIKDLT